MDTLTVKAFLEESEDGNIETRRLLLSEENLASTGLFKIIQDKVGNAFPSLQGKIFSIMWKDPDGDFILMSSDEELQDAMEYAKNKLLKVYIQVVGDKPAASSEDDSDDLPESNEKRANHEQPDPFESSWSFYQPDGSPMVPPPPPPFPGMPFPFPPHPSECHGPVRRGRHGRHHGHHGGPFGGHHKGTFGGCHGNPFGGHHGGSFGSHGGPFEGPRQGPRSRHYGGSFGGHGGPFWSHHHGYHGGPFGGHGHGDFGSFTHYHRFGGEGHGCKKNRRCDKFGWKAGLRGAVPKPHRQWAKTYIRDWRLKNLKNATTTTSESDADKGVEKMMEQAAIPESYTQWLDFKLPRWHKKWGCDEMDGDSDGYGDKQNVDKKWKKTLKQSVPKEFRKWVKWYLYRHFGRREAPIFLDGIDTYGHSWQGQCMDRGCKKPRKNGFRLRQLADQIPRGYRLWAKKFIRQWRLDNKIDEAPSTQQNESSEFNDVDAALTISEDYKNWLNKFLTRWHSWRKQLKEPADQQQDQEGMKQFKDSVPCNFRAWVRCYMSVHFDNPGRPRCTRFMDDPADVGNYKKWLQMFQKKWLYEQNQMQNSSDSDGFTVLSDSENEIRSKQKSAGTNAAKDAEKSFKRLRLSDDESQERRVHFDPSAKDKNLKEMIDSDYGDDFPLKHRQRKVFVPPQFRKLAWQAFSDWDESTVSGEEDDQMDSDSDDESIPPHINMWMMKMMMKRQKKQMKQQSKIAKHEMKASRKEQKMARKLGKY